MASPRVIADSLRPHIGHTLTTNRAARVMASIMTSTGALPTPQQDHHELPSGSGWSISSDTSAVLSFFDSRMPLVPCADMESRGLVKDGRMVAGVIYEGWNANNCWMHVCADPGSRWMTRGFLRECFAYPFITRGLLSVRGHVNASNTAARRLDEHLGFRFEALLRGAAGDGGDVILYVMRREWCRFIEGAMNGK